MTLLPKNFSGCAWVLTCAPKNPWFLGSSLSPLIFGVFHAPGRATFVTKQKWAKVGLEHAVLRTLFSPLRFWEVSPPEASNFFLGKKVTKKPLRTYGSKDLLAPAGGLWRFRAPGRE